MCRHHQFYRERLRDAIVSVLRRHITALDWVRINGCQPLHQLMTSMIPSPPSSDAISSDAIQQQHQHHTRMMIGAFTVGESKAAAKRLGCVDIAAGQSAMIELCLLCIDHTLAYYNKLKGIT